VSAEKRLGFAVCGSFCTFTQALEQMERLVAEGYRVTPIMSETAYGTDTKFGPAADFISRIETICQAPIIHTIKDAEPVGPQKLFDILLILPCTGNTLAKLRYGITDTAVTMAAKAHLRNGRPLVIGVSTNDALFTTAENIGGLLTRRNVYFVPFFQDDPQNKPRSMVADFNRISETLKAALSGEQLQPILG